MNNDGWGQVGTGPSDMRVAGKDLQHNRQKRTADEAPHEHRIVRQEAQAGGPMKEYLHEEMERHKEGKKLRVEHLEKHYKR